MNEMYVTGEVWVNKSGPYTGELKITQEVETYRSEQEVKPDLAWEYIDQNGHYHAYTTNGELPTLRRYQKNKPCNEACGGICQGEGYSVTRYDCRLCDKKVKPATITRYGITHSRPGLKTWQITARGTFGDELTDPVTVRLTTDSNTYFGIGQLTTVEMGFRDWEITLLGTGPLGERTP